MSSEPLPEPLMPTAARRQRFGIMLVLVLISAATAISYFGTNETWSVPAVPIARLSNRLSSPEPRPGISSFPNRHTSRNSRRLA